MNGCAVERFGATVNFQKTDGLSSLHLGQMLAQDRHKGFSIYDRVVVAGFHNSLCRIHRHSGNTIQHIHVGVEYIYSSLCNGRRNGVLQGCFQLALRQFALVGSESQSHRIDLEYLF